ncbi:uracil-DNA glycosylase family protein [Vibrio sp. CK2-1]|uniref:uracil-DNA glycosylase family protein n=1 Tax=Vibrio sp. CK2-1 TaxID=2912249 RepID=UPI001F201DA4|nr:uracil-DNA glycosylase family protein [Vibrio sp. CK2-1]
MTSFSSLLDNIQQCQICAKSLADGCRPVVQAHPDAKVLIIGQAPGLKVHQSGVPFNDASGERLRQWMGIDKTLFYNPHFLAIMPMGFCYPGKGKSGDLPPRKECAPQWHEQLLEQLPNIELILLIGQYAQDYYLANKPKTLTETVQAWQQYQPKYLPLPHPSPRNNIWLKKNPWFELQLVPHLQSIIAELQP